MRSFPLIAALLAAAMGCAIAAPPPFYRYISVSTYNATANVTQIAAWEFANLKNNCSKTYAAATTGINVNYLPKTNWGQFVKVIDFVNMANYTTYKTCDDLFVRKALINSFVTGKAHALVPATATTKRLDTLPDNVIFHIGLSNTTSDTQMVTLRTNLMTQFAGASVLNYLPGIFLTNSTVTPSNNHNHANILVSASAHTNVAYYYFKNGNGGNVPILPLYSQIKALQPTGGRDSEFVGLKVK